MARVINIFPFDDRDVLIKRLMKHVVVKNEDECWPWAGTEDGEGQYGMVTYRSKDYRAHRFGYEIMVRHLEPEEEVHHTCRDTFCMNPRHWRALTHAEHVVAHIGDRWGSLTGRNNDLRVN